MKENKSEQYTFAPEEKQILEILASFEEELGEKLQESNKTLECVRFYTGFTFGGEAIEGLENVFITVEKDNDGNITYNLYSTKMQKIFSMDPKGEILESIKDLEKTLGKFKIEGLMQENEKEKGRLKGISEKTNSKEIEEKLKGNKEQEKSEKKLEEQIDEQLKEQGQDLEISYYREITDNNLDERMKTDFSKYEEKGMAYSKKLNAFVLVGKKDGKTELVEGFEPAKPTMKTVISIDEKGKEIEKKVPYALMKTNNPDKEMSITIGQYGYIEAGTIDRLPCDKRIEMQQEEAGETSAGRTDRKLESAVRAEGTQGLHNWVHEHEEMLEEMKKDENIEKENLEEEIYNGGEHTYTDSEERLIEYAAQHRAKMSVEGFKEILKEIPEKGDIGKRIDDAVEIAEEEARGSSGY